MLLAQQLQAIRPRGGGKGGPDFNYVMQQRAQAEKCWEKRTCFREEKFVYQHLVPPKMFMGEKSPVRMILLIS